MPLRPLLRRPLRHGPPLVGLTLLVAGTAYVYGRTPAILAGLSGLLAWGSVWPFGLWLRRHRVVVRPGGHSGHRGAIPTMGGLAVLVPVALVLLGLSIGGNTRMLGLLIGTVLMAGMGVMDDWKGVPPRLKILVQVIGGIVLLAFGFSLKVLDAPGIPALALGPVAPYLLVFWVVLATNAFNIIDGMDGVATSVGIVTTTGLLVLGIHPVVAAPLAAALLGFLPHNLPKARIFLGDAGTMALGFLFAALVLELPTQGNIVLATGLFAYPLLDVALATTRRFVRGKPLFRGDRSHIHHKFAMHSGSEKAAPLLVTLLAIIPAALVIYRPTFNMLLLLVGLGILIAFLLVFLGQVRLHRMLGNRRPFQELHLTRQYVEGRLRLARNQSEVERALARLANDLRLTHVRVGPVELASSREEAPQAVTRRVRLAKGWGEWGFVRNGLDEERAFVLERQAVVDTLLKIADARLAATRSTATPGEAAQP